MRRLRDIEVPELQKYFEQLSLNTPKLLRTATPYDGHGLKGLGFSITHLFIMNLIEQTN